MARVSSWDKFTLLLWKNWTLQWAHKWQLAIEVVLPAVFSLLLVLVRTLVVAELQPATYFEPVNISNLHLLTQTFISDKSIEYKLLYSPKNEYLEKIVEEAASMLEVDWEGYANAVALETVLAPGTYLAGVQFDDAMANLTGYPEKLHFALRFPSELRTSSLNIKQTWYTNRLFPPIDLTGPRNSGFDDGGVPVGYLREGFLPVQNAISLAFLKLASATDSLPEIVMQRYPYPEYIYDPLLEGLSSIMFLIILLSFIYPCTNITKYITSEKEKQLKEVMKIMGLNNWIHWAAWFVKSFVMLAISSLFIAIFMKIRWTDDVAVLTYTSFSVLYFYLLIYIIASIMFCFMMATFFSKASTAAAVTGLVWFIASIPYSFLASTYDDLTLGSKLGWCLISNSAVGFGIKLILEFEGTGAGLQWSNLFEPVSVDDTLTVGYTMVMMLISSVLYMCVCLYIEQIFPGDFGVPKMWYFPFTKRFWCGEPEYIGVEDMPSGGDQRNPDAFEIEPAGKRVGLQVKNLKKRFGNKVAVKDLSVNMYEDEITVLLGHNGAGKTTTISMLTGMFPPSGGTAIINGSDIRSNIEGARMSLGICPQHNVLFDDMSVADHITFFSRLKGLKGDAIKKEVDKYLQIIELENKADVPSSKLSGGMKRKLSVCCALCGDTKVVLCDEPSSGMDPAARRQLWDLLQAEKIGRTLLLTTHFMDEADVLGDRIAIMCNGELKCHGTSFFLKKKYGSGYHLICVKLEDCNVDEVTALLERYIPGIEPEGDIGAELSYQLPDNYSTLFEEMFADLEEHSEELKLSGYGVGITSMEEVFMKVGAENANDDQPEEQTAVVNSNSSFSGEDIESIQSDGVFADNAQLLSGSDLVVNQWHAMLLKKMLYTFRNKLLLLVQNLMPIFFVVVTILISQNNGTSQNLQALTISLNQYPTVVTVLETDPSVAAGSLEANVASRYQEISTSYGPSYTHETTGSKSFTEYILDLGKDIQVRINARYLAAATVTNSSITAWLNNQPYHTAPLTVNLIHNALAKALIGDAAEITVTNAPLPYLAESLLTQLNTGNNVGTQLATNLCFCMCFVSSFYILFLIKERESRSKLLQFVGGVHVWTFWLTQLLWDMLSYIVTAVIVIITLACFQEEGFSTFNELGRNFIILILFGFAVLPFTYLISFFFTEPATGFARISIINIFAGMALFIVVVVMSFDFFDTKDTADMLAWIFRFFPHFSLAMSVNKLYTNVATRNVCSNAFVISIPETLRCQFIPACCNTTDYFAWDEPGILPETVCMIGTAFLFFGILIVSEYGLVNELIYKIRSRKFKAPPPPADGYHDDDVENEKQRISAMDANKLLNQNLVLDQVTKYYNKFLAVNQISLCVGHNECFGLLGVNGAGKTTTFKMMTGDERITFGSAYIKGMNLKSEMNHIYNEIGYCPQFDALLDDLTGRETLRVFCLLRGIKKSRINQVSEELAKSFGFMQHMDKETKAYSGGNKRKLSTAISVIGSPSAIFLDEPTTGMDPAARRQLWNMVCRLRDAGKAIILTSHSMEECEALCTRLAIMVNGEFKCIGSTQHLKNKFSKGLILKIKVKRNTELGRRASRIMFPGIEGERSTIAQLMNRDIDRVKDFVNSEFPQAILQEEYQGILTFYIPLSGIKWSVMFGLMERSREKLNIEDYSISQTTLEEIFLEFAKYQREDPRAIKTNEGCRGLIAHLLCWK